MNKQKFFLGYLTGLLFSIGLVCAFVYFQTKTSDLTIQEFEMKNLNGTKINIDDFKGKPIVINVWATWCGPCIAEFPEFEKTQNKFKNVNFFFVTDEPVTKALKFLEKRNFNLNFVTSDNNFSKMGIKIRPVTYFFDKKGDLVNKIDGDTFETEIISILNTILEK